MSTVSKTDTPTGRWAVDVLLEAYVAWREQCHVVWKAYQLWADSDSPDVRLAHAGYLAALDAEERAARTYADQLECVRQIAT
jgi:hypothetical protein